MVLAHLAHYVFGLAYGTLVSPLVEQSPPPVFEEVVERMAKMFWGHFRSGVGMCQPKHTENWDLEYPREAFLVKAAVIAVRREVLADLQCFQLVGLRPGDQAVPDQA
jgi:hypothetical protein